MHKSSKVHFLTAYVEYLLTSGIRSEEYYVGDASRFLRYLLANITEADVINFINHSAQSTSYKNRLRRTLRKFFVFGSEVLAIENLSLILKKTR
ncbi:MAG: hypothetical protein ACE3NC_07835 [Candidatus Wallacebacter cryptica]|jgi:hypothetical protein|nr:hypothetical protein [Bacillota bacterium]